MARARAPRKAPAADRSPETRLIEAALALAARKGWRRISLAEIAEEAGLRLHEAYALHRSKGSILRAFIRRIDAAVLAGAGPSDESARERLFDTLMRRFDALKPYKDGVRAIVRDSMGHPASLLGLPVLARSMAWMLEASGISSAGCRGRLAAKATAALYLSVLRVYLSDDSADLGRTMAALDRALRRAESVCRFMPQPRREAAQAA
jgi:AcrR family transcriptional regulator